ncbi:glycosyltransferase [Mycobacterium sp. E740]|uniref:glycosyltransferase n=1 Tax=Mycobacterium sp. E740 TaxID=1834149 RepID=UPI0007FF2305|nr:glycosyltransferase [Mycobacterium sp. E740]OBI74855.1 hypothetical protein A5663_00425 [Mycobacterium sp. E740]
MHRANSTTLCVNGKWLAQSASGTHRYATEVMRVISATPLASAITLVLPRDAVEPPWAAKFHTVRSRFRGLLFEQIALIWLTRGSHLFSLAGPAPVLKRNQTLVMHDATPFRFPSTFRLAFVLWYRFMYGLLSRTAKRVLTVSSFSREQLAGVLKVPPHRFELAPCGADHIRPETPESSSRPLPFDRGTFALIVGNLAPHKNVGPAVSALAAAGVPVAVVGGAEHVQHVFRSVALDSRDNVHLLGRIDDAELQHLYAAAAVLVAPSRYEGFCIPVIEAGRLGCPTVYATGSAITEVAGRGGLGFDPDDMDQCVRSVQRIVGDPEFRSELGTLARSNAERFSWERTAHTIFGDWAELLGATASPLRVLHVTETFAGGIRAAVLGYANAVGAQEVESSLLAQDRGIGLFEELDGSSPFAQTRMVPHGLMSLWRAIGSTVDELRPDVVHFHSSLAGGVGRLRPGLRRKAAVVYSPHCFAFEMSDISAPRRWFYRCAEFLLARRTAGFVCVSPHEAELARNLGSRADVVTLINLFTPAQFPAERTVPQAPQASATGERTRIVTVGRLTAQKDPDLFSEIVSALRETGDIEATWVGDGDASTRTALQAQNVCVTGWLPAREVPKVLAGQDVYLHTAGWEAAAPLVVFEAIEAGLPVVVRRITAYRSMLPLEWQFDDAASAVRMIRELQQEPARSRRVREQFELLAELRRDSPDLVLAAAYRRILIRSGAALRTKSDRLHRNGRQHAPSKKVSP